MFYFLGAIVVIGLVLVFTYNSLVNLRQRVQNAWSQVDVQLRRRFDLIPNLVNTVKGYAKHEKETFAQITEARTRAMAATTVQDQVEAENMLGSTLKSLFALAENYPELKADNNFRQLQEELSTTENKIAFSRQFYNDTVQKYNTKLEVFPTVLFAGMFGFTAADYFNLDSEADARRPVNIKFD